MPDVSAESPLRAECRLLGRQVFGLEAEAACLDAYESAHGRIFSDAELASPLARALPLAVERAWDLEALEFALRLRDPANVLTKKLNLLSYLVEASPAGYPLYVNDRQRRLKAWTVLVWMTLRSCFKLLRGRLLLRRLPLVLGAKHV